jgi:anti-sigma factor RsiW
MKDDRVISCQQLVDFCLDYIEGDLPEQERNAFRRHLGHCPDCVNFFETYRRTPEISREVLRTQIPPSVKASVMAYLRERVSGG